MSVYGKTWQVFSLTKEKKNVKLSLSLVALIGSKTEPPGILLIYRKKRNWFTWHKSHISPKSIDGAFYPARDTRYPSTCFLRFPNVRFTRYYTSFNLASLQNKFNDSVPAIDVRFALRKCIYLYSLKWTFHFRSAEHNHNENNNFY